MAQQYSKEYLQSLVDAVKDPSTAVRMRQPEQEPATLALDQEMVAKGLVNDPETVDKVSEMADTPQNITVDNAALLAKSKGISARPNIAANGIDLASLRDMVTKAKDQRVKTNLLADSGQISDKLISTMGNIKTNDSLYSGMKTQAEGDVQDAQKMLQSTTVNSALIPSDFTVEGGPNNGANVLIDKTGRTKIYTKTGELVDFIPTEGEKMVKIAKTMTDFAKDQGTKRLDLAVKQFERPSDAAVTKVTSAMDRFRQIRTLESVMPKITRGYKGKGSVSGAAMTTIDLSPDEVTAVQTAGRLLAEFVKDISGAAVTEAEATRLSKLIPSVDMAPQAFATSLARFKDQAVASIKNHIRTQEAIGKDMKKIRELVEESLGESLDAPSATPTSNTKPGWIPGKKIPAPGEPGRREYLEAKSRGEV